MDFWSQLALWTTAQNSGMSSTGRNYSVLKDTKRKSWVWILTLTAINLWRLHSTIQQRSGTSWQANASTRLKDIRVSCLADNLTSLESTASLGLSIGVANCGTWEPGNASRLSAVTTMKCWTLVSIARVTNWLPPLQTALLVCTTFSQELALLCYKATKTRYPRYSLILKGTKSSLRPATKPVVYGTWTPAKKYRCLTGTTTKYFRALSTTRATRLSLVLRIILAEFGETQRCWTELEATIIKV